MFIIACAAGLLDHCQSIQILTLSVIPSMQQHLRIRMALLTVDALSHTLLILLQEGDARSHDASGDGR